MTDLEILKQLEQKLNIRISDYEIWAESKSKSKDLREQQLFKLSPNGNVLELYLNGLNLNEIPDEIFELKKLQRFDCVQNNIQNIPLRFQELKEIKQLFFLDNNITELPNEIVFLENLEELEIHNNPLKSIPIEIIYQDSTKNKSNLESLRNYINSLKAGTKNLNEVKVIIVGDGGAGKTSLQKLLINEKFDPQESQTHGINIKHLTLRPNKSSVKFRLWDFGGQEIMHATHQFFLSRRSIYIILLNAREEPNPEYWLNHIKTFGGDSPVIIIINKTDENPSYDINRLFLKEKYPNIIDFIKISCLKNSGIDNVKNALKDAVIGIQDLNSKWALSWFNVKIHLENMTTNFISYDEFTNLCEENGIRDASSQNTLVEYLNDLGIILHFKDFALSDTHVLEPEWVTFAVYKILNSKKLVDNKGVLKLSEVRTILKKDENDGKFKYPSSALHYVIELMIKFELCYKVSETEILIPDLLAVQEPRFELTNNESLKIIINYSFLPKSVFPRIVVNLHNDIKNDLKWRTGMIIEDLSLNSIAKITADYELKEINIEVFGEKKRDYLSIILFIIRKINASFKGLEYKVNIPIRGTDNVKVSFSHLQTLESKGIDKYIPDGVDFEIDVKELLGNIQGKKNYEEEILAVLDKLVSKTDDQQNIYEKANEIIQLQPNFFGLGININALVKKYLKNK